MIGEQQELVTHGLGLHCMQRILHGKASTSPLLSSLSSSLQAVPHACGDCTLLQ
jgi:hypothetical protein